MIEVLIIITTLKELYSAGVLGSTITVWISDSDQNKEKTKLFLDARISNVMSFEKSKFKVIEKLKIYQTLLKFWVE